jgi:hypothetical protein
MSTKKATPIRAVTNFSTLKPSDLAALTTTVIKGMTGNTAFPTPPVDLTALNTALNSYSAAVAAALDGGKNAKAVRDKQRKLVIQDLRLLAVYVENNCNEDMTIFSTSGFTAKTVVKAAPGPIATPVIRKVDYGQNSGQILVYMKAVPGAYSYNVRYAVMTGTTPGAWTTLPIATVVKAVTMGGLTAGTTYGIEVQALGSMGYSDWSDTTTIMCV